MLCHLVLVGLCCERLVYVFLGASHYGSTEYRLYHLFASAMLALKLGIKLRSLAAYWDLLSTSASAKCIVYWRLRISGKPSCTGDGLPILWLLATSKLMALAASIFFERSPSECSCANTRTSELRLDRSLGTLENAAEAGLGRQRHTREGPSLICWRKWLMIHIDSPCLLSNRFMVGTLNRFPFSVKYDADVRRAMQDPSKTSVSEVRIKRSLLAVRVCKSSVGLRASTCKIYQLPASSCFLVDLTVICAGKKRCGCSQSCCRCYCSLF